MLLNKEKKIEGKEKENKITRQVGKEIKYITPTLSSQYQM